MRQHPIDVVAGSCGRLGRMSQHAGNDLADGRVARSRFGSRQAKAVFCQPIANLSEPLGKTSRLRRREPFLDLTVRIEQQPLDQVTRQGLAVHRTQIAGHFVDGFVERRWEDGLGRRAFRFGRVQQGLPHFVDADPSMGLRRDDRNPQPLGEGRHVDRGAPLSCHVRHVEDKHSRQPDVEHLADEKQIAFEVGCVDDAGHRVEPADLRLTSQ